MSKLVVCHFCPPCAGFGSGPGMPSWLMYRRSPRIWMPEYAQYHSQAWFVDLPQYLKVPKSANPVAAVWWALLSLGDLYSSRAMTIQVKLCSNCSVVSLEISIKPHHARPKRTIQCNHPSSWYSRNPCCSSILQFTTSWVPLLELLACDGLPRSQATPKLLFVFHRTCGCWPNCQQWAFN